MESGSVHNRRQSSENSIYVGNSAIPTVPVHLANVRLLQRPSPLLRPHLQLYFSGFRWWSAGPLYLSFWELRYLDGGHLPGTFATPAGGGVIDHDRFSGDFFCWIVFLEWRSTPAAFLRNSCNEWLWSIWKSCRDITIHNNSLNRMKRHVTKCTSVHLRIQY